MAEIAARMRQHHDAVEAQRLEQEKRIQAGRDSIARNKLKEQEVLDLVEEAVDEINRHLAETKIKKRNTYSGREFRFRGRVLHLHFFQPEQLYPNSVRPGLKDVLRARHVVHGGYIEIKEQGEHREGWNLVLVRSPESMYGEWQIVETRVSQLTGRGTRYEPRATEATLFAENLAYHWMHSMHVYDLTDKALAHEDIMKILRVFIPNP